MRLCVDEQTGAQRRLEEFLETKIARMMAVVLLGAVGTLPLVILTPPFQIPDEVQHFYRAYQLSEFHLRAEVRDGVAGGTLPDSLPLLVKSTVYTSDAISYPATPEPLSKTMNLASIPLLPEARHFVGFPGSAFYSPLPYLPAVLGIEAGRTLGWGPLSLLYVGRACNCLAALALLGLAVYAMPIGEEFLAMAGLLPMALYLYASLSADAALIGCALLFSALAFRSTLRGDWRTWELGVAAAAGALFCSVKPVYAPLLLAAMAPGIFERKRAGVLVRQHAVVLAVAMGVTVGWLLFARSTMTTPLSGSHPATQASLVLHHPAMLASAMVHTLNPEQIVVYCLQAIGVFGWLTVPLLPVGFFLPVVNFVVLWNIGVRGRGKRSATRAVWYLALAAVSGLLVIAAIYLMWAHVGQANVTGVQGRYFLPLLGLVAMAAIELAPEQRTARWKGMAITAGIVLAQIAAMDATIVRGFHVF